MSSTADDQNPPAAAAAAKTETPAMRKISLKTADNECFEVEETLAMEFGAVKNFIEEDNDGIRKDVAMPLPNVSARSLRQIIEYCKKQLEFRTTRASEESKREFDNSFLSEINIEDLKELLMAVNYLEIKYFLDVLNQAFAKRIENKSVEYVRRLFGIESDFTPEEEQRLRNQHPWAFEGVDDD